MTKKIDLVEKGIKTIIIIIFLYSRRQNKRGSMIKRDTEDIKDPSQTSRDEN